jgi:hypothetical protein
MLHCCVPLTRQIQFRQLDEVHRKWRLRSILQKGLYMLAIDLNLINMECEPLCRSSKTVVAVELYMSVS